MAAGGERAPNPSRLETLSPSRAADFKSCPRRFRYVAVDHLETAPTTHQARGIAAHLALQRLFDLPAEERTLEALADLFRSAWLELRTDRFSDLFATTEEERAWGIESLRVLANYFGVEDPSRIEPLERELDLREPIGPMTIRGILDRLDDTDDGLVVVDYKTGKAPPERHLPAAFFALKIYALLVRSRTGRTPIALRLIYLRGPTVYERPVDDGVLDAMERQLHALWAAIERALARDDFPPRPGPLCPWCDFQDICPAFTPAPAAGPASPAAPAGPA